MASAKARFSEVIDQALIEGPQVVTRNGVETVVIISLEEWERKSQRRGTLADFLASSPLRNSGLTMERSKKLPRSLKL